MRNGLKSFFLITISFVLIGILAYQMFISTYTLFDESAKIVLKQENDYQNVRRATLYKMGGNATSNPSLHIEISDCSENPKTSLIFAADKPNLNDEDVALEWHSFDTLIVSFNKDLRIFTKSQYVRYPDTILNVTIVYRQML